MSSMKYLLKKDEQDKGMLCDKVTIDGFDYYMSDKMTTQSCMFYGNRYKINELHKYEIGIDSLSFLKEQGIKSCIATSNQNIDLPKVVDEVDFVCEIQQYFEGVMDGNTQQRIQDYKAGLEDGYNKSQSTHHFTEQDMIAFGKYLSMQTDEDGLVLNPQYIKDNKLFITEKELLEYWKSQQPKVIYYHD